MWARPDHDRADLRRMEAEFRARVDHETWLLHSRIQEELGEVHDYERERFLDALEKHLPGLAPVVRLVAYHVTEEAYADPSECCGVGA